MSLAEDIDEMSYEEFETLLADLIARGFVAKAGEGPAAKLSVTELGRAYFQGGEPKGEA